MSPPPLLSPLKELPQSGLSDGRGQVPAVENLHPGHRVLVRSLQGVGPVHNDVTVPSLDLATAKTPREEKLSWWNRQWNLQQPFSLTSGLVRVVLQETKPAVVGLVVRIGVDDDINQTS